MALETPLHGRHVALGARLVDFGGWDMPLHYGSQLEEHHRVRRDAGMFDVSHMRAVDVAGPAATPFLRRARPVSSRRQRRDRDEGPRLDPGLRLRR